MVNAHFAVVYGSIFDEHTIFTDQVNSNLENKKLLIFYQQKQRIITVKGGLLA